MPTPDTCPNCGADLPPRARVCPECGSDERTGWSEEAGLQGLSLPDDRFSYDDFIEEEFGESEKIKPHGVSWIWWIIAFLLVLGFIVMLAWH